MEIIVALSIYWNSFEISIERCFDGLSKFFNLDPNKTRLKSSEIKSLMGKLKFSKREV